MITDRMRKEVSVKRKIYPSDIPLCAGKMRRIMKCGIMIAMIALGMTACGQTEKSAEEKPAAQQISSETPVLDTGVYEEAGTFQREEEPQEDTVSYIIKEGDTIESRILTPKGYSRNPAEEGSFASFLRNYPLKEDESPVLLYNGAQKRNQNAHIAVTKLPMEAEDLQQCADSVMRMYAEYFWQTGQYERIAFHFVSGFSAEYTKWREGYRILVSGNEADWVKSETFDDSYEAFVSYLRMVFAYAGTLSMEGESKEISLSQIAAGDVFLKGASPGHVVMILDICENADGKKAFLLGQGYMPAQEFHVLKNPLHEGDPWYYEEEVTYPFLTPEYTFSEGSLRRLEY